MSPCIVRTRVPAGCGTNPVGVVAGLSSGQFPQAALDASCRNPVSPFRCDRTTPQQWLAVLLVTPIGVPLAPDVALNGGRSPWRRKIDEVSAKVRIWAACDGVP